ncbi:MAG: hypothetical protein LQ352_005957 [Teloschistes flavicans]|nr:MAG: hypothetical protein LQ352_005957 [Teloschistes flavicans]
MASNRHSTYSGASTPTGVRSNGQYSNQVSTTTLLNTLHTIYASAQPFRLDAGTSLVVNTWLTANTTSIDGRQGGTIDTELARQIWEHARRRAEDGCVVLGSLHHSTPSLLTPFISALPVPIPSSLHTAIAVLRPFTHSVSPYNHSTPKHSSLAVTFNLSLAGNLNSATLALSTSGIDITSGLLNIPSEAGYRAFDVFYYLLTSASTPAEREFLGLKPPSAYSLLNRSQTYDPPSYLPTADDAASAEDFRSSLKEIGIKGSAHRNLLSTLTGLLKLGDTTGFLVDEETLEEICEDVGGLLGLNPDVLMRKCSTDERDVLIAGIYEALVDWVLVKANQAIAAALQRSRDGDDLSDSGSGRIGTRTPRTDEDNEDTVSITVVEIPSQDLGKAVALRGVFDDSVGINAEMREDGLEVATAGISIIKEMQSAVSEVAADLGIAGGPIARDREYERARQEDVLEKVGVEAEVGGFLRNILYPREGEGVTGSRHSRLDLPAVLGSSRVWYHLAIHPTDESPGSLASLATTTSAWSAGTVSRQLRAWRLPEWTNRRHKVLDFTADFDIEEFHTRYARLGCQEGRDGVESWILERGWSNGEVVVGHDRVWIREGAWWEAESMLDLKPVEHPYEQHGFAGMGGDFHNGYSPAMPDLNGSGFFPPPDESNPFLSRRQSQVTLAKSGMGFARSIAPTVARTVNTMPGDYGLGAKGDDTKGQITYYDPDLGQYTSEMDPELGEPKSVHAETITISRRIWIGFVWALTFWMPSFMLRHVGRMKRPDVRFAWREKVVLMLMIFLLNATVIFYIVAFGRLLCPNYDKVWNDQEVGTHTGDDDFYVSVRGQVFDISKFWRLPHSDMQPQVTTQTMQPFAGMNLDDYFPPPLTTACRGLVTSEFVQLTPNDTITYSNGVHTSGPTYQTDNTTALHDIHWYDQTFLPKMKEYYKGDLVIDKGNVTSQGTNDGRQWVILYGKVYDLTDYFHTVTLQNKNPLYTWLPDDVSDLITNNPGNDITSKWKDTANFTKAFGCMENVFVKGKLDFRKTPKCQVNNYILLAFTVILCTVILVKFLAALQLGSKRRPAAQDKFVICQVPAYTEGEDQLRKGLDSLTALQYDNKRKLICVVCDGMIVGGGNDRPTPKIVLDILGVDPKIDPPALPFKGIGQGNEKLNYGKVYSGLYEFEGNVVPYIVVVKVGKESEQTKAKPGNRGKRDSQVLLLSFLNRVHHRAPMSPLELEMFHQINNIIGVDPELYEYLLMVDADTSVKEDSLNRLVASCANDAKIAGICGETSLENEERSWWTMIQVYEYYISHHLAKAFESLFGSVTCLPGCFCMYRLRTADKGRPLIISDKVITEYEAGNVDTLHKKNLLALGEDRYLTTLMTKHFPSMSFKFIPDAFASTAAPETWSVLLSQRRRWINSTIHNLFELVKLRDLCGFCCFSMRFVVFIDLFGTVILPATCCYLGYLIYRIATHSGQFPLISIIMIAAVYGLQAIIFIIRRQWQHVGWMIIYIMAFPIYSFVLPVYSFWNQDNFSWGNTRIVIGEKGNKQIVALEDEDFNPRSVPLQRWDDYAAANNLPGRRGMAGAMEKSYPDQYTDAGHEIDDAHSMYSSIKPASTILTGFHNQAPAYMPPQSPAGFATRQSTMSNIAPYTDRPQYQHQRFQSVTNMSDHYTDALYGNRSGMPSPDNLMAMQSPPLRQSRSPLGYPSSRPMSIVDFRGEVRGPDDGAIVEAVQSCLGEVNLDSVTKKQVRALVEQRLQTELTGDKRVFLDRQIDEQLANM